MPTATPDLLKGLSEDQAARLKALGTPTTLAAGQTLFRFGDEADALYLVVRGRIALTLPMQILEGEEEVLVEERQAGETVGWSGLVPPHRFTLNAAATIPSELCAFPRAVLLDHFLAHPSVGYAVTRNVAAVMGHRLQVFQTMWLREMQRAVDQKYA
jgi:CRP-like cAMP-binding protein